MGKTVRSGGRHREPDRREGRLAFWLWMALAAILFSLVALLAGSWGRHIGERQLVQSSTLDRTPLAEGLVRKTEYYQDGLGWIKNSAGLKRGMEYFYRKTGAQPYLLLTDRVNGSVNPTYDDFAAFAEASYARLFRDQGHVLLIIFANEAYPYNYYGFCQRGSAAEAVMDDEAVDILLDYTEVLYAEAEASGRFRGDRLFAEVFRNTARDMMHVQARRGWIWVLALTAAGVLSVALLDFSRAYRKERLAEARELSGAGRAAAAKQ